MKLGFKKFHDIRAKDINFNFHIHIDQTGGISTPEEILEKAMELNLGNCFYQKCQ